MEETLELGATDSFHRYRTGCTVNAFSLAIAARAKVTASSSRPHRPEGDARCGGIVTGATYTAATTEPILTTLFRSVAALAVAGLNPVPKVRSLNLEFNNNLRERPVVGSLFTEEFGAGRFDSTGTRLRPISRARRSTRRCWTTVAAR